VGVGKGNFSQFGPTVLGLRYISDFFLLGLSRIESSVENQPYTNPRSTGGLIGIPPNEAIGADRTSQVPEVRDALNTPGEGRKKGTVERCRPFMALKWPAPGCVCSKGSRCSRRYSYVDDCPCPYPCILRSVRGSARFELHLYGLE
jgi:hypothetical protein